MTGGVGARFLGIGGSTKYREDTVTVYLRAVSVKTGEVLLTVSVRKSIASIGLSADAFRYVAFKELLEVEAGIATNEPDALALQQAFDAAFAPHAAPRFFPNGNTRILSTSHWAVPLSRICSQQPQNPGPPTNQLDL